MDDLAQVSIAAMESALEHLQEANRRLARLLALSWLVVALIVGGVLYFATHFELIASDIHLDAYDGPANYIGNDGDINNGPR